ncbi:uracil phosphoribosyltransferase-domain-containing protein [Daldinia decipiens]|uniref:uracil phosphoribosyltransferase-domain-containing protein n=1 Tax=Daldinia decipiens TaxID=326647 RepID=UPI0020C485B9|nr:uracil phosphoribosyltransferase-domain-containing protein [Daldinia decipiens]KAI1652833.1 uracil phosphoribosyltransferase-domain-containing protein [Daldinia decipiens]
MSTSSANPETSRPSGPQTLDSSLPKPVIIGLYGVPGCGKSYLLKELKRQLIAESFDFYEGSEVISSLVPGGLDAFKKFKNSEKEHYRKLAIDHIAQSCSIAGRVGVVSGHFMFWEEGEHGGQIVCTQKDLEVYTHILYLNINPELISIYRSGDTGRARPLVSVEHLCKWQEAEKTQLRQLCYDNGILFSSISPKVWLPLSKISILIRDFQSHTANMNLARATDKLDDILAKDAHQLHTMLVLDADKTLVAEDTGTLFWEIASRRHPELANDVALKTIFSSKLGYSYSAFRQAALLYEESFRDDAFDLLCEMVAASVTLRPEFRSLLQRVKEDNHVGALVVTCGLRQIWDKILRIEGLSGAVKVIGGGRISDGFVVTPEVKASLVLHLRSTYGLHTWAFGDSPLDLAMLVQANKAVVIVGEEKSRSKSMDTALLKAIDNGLQAYQDLLPRNVPSRLDTRKLPLVNIYDPKFIDSIFSGPLNNNSHELRLVHATEKRSAKLLMTPMRNAMVAGHNLREAHQNAGWYLATEFLSELVGVEEYPIDHVQGNKTSGHRLRHEQDTLIVPLMRGGEAMAFGVSRAIPLARFVHASRPDDIKADHLHNIRTVVLVDSVINNGGTIVEFTRYVRKLSSGVRVVVITGVVQGKSISPGGQVSEYAREAGLELIALRVSDNKYTGSGGTDTGNRLFNTTHLSR